MNREKYREAMDSLSFSADFSARTAALLQTRVRQQEKEEVKMLKKSKKITVLLAAAVALLAMSVSAAHFGTLQEIVWELKTAFFVSGETEDGSFAAIRIPEVRLLEREDRVILNVEGEETDITDALETEQCYLVEQAEEDGRLVIEITGTPEDCVCTITGYQTGMEEALFTVTRGKNEPLTEADISYSVAREETAALMRPLKLAAAPTVRPKL